MAALPQNTNTTHYLIDQHWFDQQDGGNRPHLGASIIGRSCNRSLWYAFRWAVSHKHSGRLLRLFDRGQKEEDRFCSDLRLIGCQVLERDPKTGKQFNYKDVAGHFGGSADATALGLPESPNYWHIVEMKTHNDKSFKELAAKGVKESKPEHWHQMNLYMHWSGHTRAIYMAVNKNDDTLYTERVKYDKELALSDIKKAKSIITSSVPPSRLSDDPTYYLCKWCDYYEICHEQNVPQVTCRTCCHATPELDGNSRWSCKKYSTDISVETQHKGGQCPSHLIIPDLIGFAKTVDANVDENWIEYQYQDKIFRNGIGGYASSELNKINPDVIGDESVETFRAFFDAKVVG